MYTEGALLPGWQGWRAPAPPCRIGILEGEGIGPEVISVSLGLIEVLGEYTDIAFDIRRGGAIGGIAERDGGEALTAEVLDFCARQFSAGGAVLCGPGGGRFVYDLRRRLDLFCKLVPLQPLACLADAGVIRPDGLTDVDIMIVRENVGGLYQGRSEEIAGEDGRGARHSFGYDEAQVRRIVTAALGVAQRRQGHLTLVHKPGGVPAVSRLWCELSEALANRAGVRYEALEVDNACYQVIADPRRFDVIVAPNMFGDVLADGAALLLASRGMSYSANFGTAGCAVYQTGHGAAHDLAGSDRANPVGQIHSVAMMLRESFGLDAAADRVQQAVSDVLGGGWRTPDVMAPGCREIGTRELGDRIAEALRQRLQRAPVTAPPATAS